MLIEPRSRQDRASRREKALSFAGRRVADDLDVVALAVLHEGGVVIATILRPRSGFAVILAAGGERRRVEGVDLFAVPNTKCIVAISACSPIAREPKDIFLFRPDPEGAGKIEVDLHPD